MRNTGLKLRMAVVGAILFGFYLAAAFAISEMTGFGLLPILAIGLLVVPAAQYKFGKWAATRGAEPMPDEREYAKVHRMTESLARDMGVEKPKLMVQDMGVPNAFAVGRKGAGVVCVSNELLHLLDDDELEGVIAHEIAHIKNRDVITMVIGQSIGMIVGYVAFLAVAMSDEIPGGFLVGYIASIFANMLVMIFVMAISRYREYVADDDAREAIGSGDPLARALEKISAGSQDRDPAVQDSVNALCIFNADKSLMAQLFATHPPAEKRIEALRSGR